MLASGALSSVATVLSQRKLYSPTKLSTLPPCHPEFMLLGFDPKGLGTMSLQNQHMDVCKFIHSPQALEATRCSSGGGWVNGRGSIPTGTFFSTTKKRAVRPREELEEPQMHTVCKKPA